MAASEPLKGIELIDCAKANAKQGIEVAANLCGYGDDLTEFRQQLHQACQQIGVEMTELSDLITEQQTVLQTGGIEIAPDTASEL
ncbi:MAG: hypothetical protein EDM05_042120 [Leptolyngbya sp. IPPAS B-1204]|uniref:Uncharacterized protein n=1 Tax=Leptolyngbya sp. NK1-12 TaxID=2547451 RepID=A0AA96WDE1_9CYAN|nr:hypothetical protein [Leptolyngbya sp. NK1-12]MBF2045966.1 hypothetical protein [Elainella sp. C42_A2020_010]RNJ68305.1 MAG: hypothetical protein EDM05_14380 [Leptolyngbya sp. IPPAS B-1204]WNZ24202.1 hypothetical protein HJG54_15970 [Leptolyngbya sp. NK1-12]